MTDALTTHREANANAADDLAARIKQANVEFIYYQFVSINGRVLAKVVPAAHLKRSLDKGVQFHGSAIADVAADRHGELFGGGIAAEEFAVMPDADSFQVLPWEPSVGRFLCSLYRRDDSHRDPGAPLSTDVRGVMRRAIDGLEERTGYELRSGTEPEVTWKGEGYDPVARPGVSTAYHAGTLELTREIYQRVIRYALAMGIDMIEGDYEDAGQIELNFMYDRADRTADRLLTYRQICVQVARELGIEVTFMPKPEVGIMGNGCHHNLSLWKDGQNTFAEPGRRELHITETAKHALGGLLAHAAESMAVYGSTVNSYKRYWDAGQFAPSRVDWGLDDRSRSVRISASGRLELKLPDSIVNPYLSHALIAAAMEDGLTNAIDPGPAPDPGVTGPEKFDSLPLTLGDAVEKFASSAFVRGALGADLTDLYTEFKRDEWARFSGAITDWEDMMYRQWIP
ncbi:MAG: glutamine synthetase family protein [Actinobacteria bacterium]|nr:glutamine synthetase family protein [Actinomycetota bacterium]